MCITATNDKVRPERHEHNLRGSVLSPHCNHVSIIDTIPKSSSKYHSYHQKRYIVTSLVLYIQCPNKRLAGYLQWKKQRKVKDIESVLLFGGTGNL